MSNKRNGSSSVVNISSMLPLYFTIIKKGYLLLGNQNFQVSITNYLKTDTPRSKTYSQKSIVSHHFGYHQYHHHAVNLRWVSLTYVLYILLRETVVPHTDNQIAKPSNKWIAHEGRRKEERY